LADCRALPAQLRPLVRYLWIGNLQDRETALKVLTFHVNQLSRNPELIPPKVVSANLLRVNLLDYQWDREVWERLAALDPYFHPQVDVEEVEQWGIRQRDGTYTEIEQRKTGKKVRQVVAGSKEIADLYSLTASASPLLRADWWFSQTARQLSLTNKETGVGYYDWLGIKDRKSFEKLIRLDPKASQEVQKEMRAAVEKSGIATQGRQIVRYQSITGAAYTTFDTDDGSGDGNPIRNLKRGAFKHKAEEHYGTLPNGLFAFLLCDADGAKQSSAPDFIGVDDSPLRTGRDARIHPCLSCVRCHVEGGLRPIDDWVRRRAKDISSPDYGELLTLRRQYFSNLNRQLEKDRQVYREALKDCNGWTPEKNATEFSKMFSRYTSPVDCETAAVELGVTVEKLRRTFANYPEPSLAGLAAQPCEPIQRVHFEELFGTAMGALK
jgi:hypothetical protein